MDKCKWQKHLLITKEERIRKLVMNLLGRAKETLDDHDKGTYSTKHEEKTSREL
jgi:hypothetical protein